MNVVRTKAFSTVENANVNTSVTTEFEWSVHSLGPMLKASLHKVFPAGVKGIASPRFKIEGTKDSSSLWIEGNVERRGEPYKVSITSDVPIEGELTVLCGGKEHKMKALLPEGERTATLCSIKSDTELHAAMEASANLCVLLRVKPLPRQKMVDSVVTGTLAPVEAAPSIAEVLKDALTSSELQDLADVELIAADGEKVRAHGQLLALRSPVFRATFHCGMRESQTKCTNVQASGSAVKGLLQCIYTDEVDLAAFASCAGELLDLGMQYQVPRLVALTHKYLLETLSIENVPERLLLSIRYDAPKLQEESIRLVKLHLTSVMATEGWPSIANSAEVMKLLLSTDLKRPEPSHLISARMAEILESAKKRPRFN